MSSKVGKSSKRPRQEAATASASSSNQGWQPLLSKADLEGDEDLEIVLIRCPAAFDASKLNGKELSLEDFASGALLEPGWKLTPASSDAQVSLLTAAGGSADIVNLELVQKRPRVLEVTAVLPPSVPKAVGVPIVIMPREDVKLRKKLTIQISATGAGSRGPPPDVVAKVKSSKKKERKSSAAQEGGDS